MKGVDRTIFENSVFLYLDSEKDDRFIWILNAFINNSPKVESSVKFLTFTIGKWDHMTDILFSEIEDLSQTIKMSKPLTRFGAYRESFYKDKGIKNSEKESRKPIEEKDLLS